MEDSSMHTCPFCGLQDSNDYQMLLHVEIYHSENGDSPFAVKDAIAASSSAAIPSPQPLVSTSSESAHPSSCSITTNAYNLSQAPLPPQSSSSAITSSSSAAYINCPYKCGEQIPAAELQFHTDLHMAEDMALQESEITVTSSKPASRKPKHTPDDMQDTSDTNFSTSIPGPLRTHGEPGSDTPKITKTRRDTRRLPSLREIIFGSVGKKQIAVQTTTSRIEGIKRLGTAELGPYAHEDRMPRWLQRMLEQGADVAVFNKIGPDGTLVRVEAIANETPDLVPVLARLSALDRHVSRAYYCRPEVCHVAKMRGEGGFCGYRNIQMLISYIRDAKARGHEQFRGRRLPSVIRLQTLIENAWDMGYNSSGRIETGGIKYTRKYIGTPEAHALFLSLGMPAEAFAYSAREEREAYETLMTAIFIYFEGDTDIDTDIDPDRDNDDDDDRDRDRDQRQRHHRVFITDRPPIYFQHQGHSMTIVGVESMSNGAANLVVFDPMFSPSHQLKRLTGARSFSCSDPGRLLKPHRRGEAYLAKYKDFELLQICDR